MSRFLPSAILVLIVCTAVSAQEPTLTQAPAAPATADTARPGDPDPDEFVPGAAEPTFDYAELQRQIRYPEEARRNGLEGTVVLRVLISEDGTPLRYRVEQADSRIFVESAAAAIMATTFTPGTQAGKPVRLWTSIPVLYRLSE